jgi:hypothetical protein
MLPDIAQAKSGHSIVEQGLNLLQDTFNFCSVHLIENNIHRYLHKVRFTMLS